MSPRQERDVAESWVAATQNNRHNVPFSDATHFYPDPPLAQDSHERFTAMAKTGARKKLPKEVAIINADNCTGWRRAFGGLPGRLHLQGAGLHHFGPADLVRNRCGTLRWMRSLCPHPHQEIRSLELLVCPWDAIEMIKTVDVAHAVAEKGGPTDYLRENWDRVVEPAIRMAELAAANS
ncbi:MAG: hypothetical protein CM1200mP2_11050 [Planctomycetaceae bacterium]|nr:MAG: hypothetical protein CM1200mP2_11050 [Planctomycetaceae bacterium]